MLKMQDGEKKQAVCVLLILFCYVERWDGALSSAAVLRFYSH